MKNEDADPRMSKQALPLMHAKYQAEARNAPADYSLMDELEIINRLKSSNVIALLDERDFYEKRGDSWDFPGKSLLDLQRLKNDYIEKHVGLKRAVNDYDFLYQQGQISSPIDVLNQDFDQVFGIYDGLLSMLQDEIELRGAE